MNILTKEQSDMIDELLIGRTITDIAKNVIKVHPSTLYRWLDKPEVKAELEQRRQALRKAAKDRITGNILDYVNNMILLANQSTDQRVKFNANKYLIDQCIGTATTAKEDNSDPGDSDKNKDSNQLKKELEDIKNLKVVK